MKEYDNSKTHIISNFVLSVSVLIMLDTLLQRPSLYCNTSLHFTTFHPTTLHYTYRHFTSSHLHFTNLSFGLTQLHFLPFYFTSHHQTRHSTVLISKLISKIMNLFTALKNLSPFHFTSLFISSLLIIRYSYQILMKSWFLFKDFEKKRSNVKFHENPSRGSRFFPCGRTDRQIWWS
jgi:hypothetical protein